MSKRHLNPKIYLLEDIAQHKTKSDCWVVFDNKVYDVTHFLESHPGGDDVILAFGGKDVTEVMQDVGEHAHSEAAYAVLSDFQVGVVGAEESIVREDFVYREGMEFADTDTSGDFARNRFLDLEKPLFLQMLRSNFSKRFYLQQVHQPRHLPHPCRLFGPWYLEALTRTPWYVVPVVWLPIAGYIFHRALQQHMAAGHSLLGAFSIALPCFFLGNAIWMLLEYIFHRFLFHMDYYLPDNSVALTLHFLLHGIHHYLPMDPLRLVMPPTLFFALQTPMTQLAYALFPVAIANGIIAGSFTFYVGYDMMHYAFHHTRMPDYVREQKTYHMEHHYKNPDAGYGVTTKFLDILFGTTFEDYKKSHPIPNVAKVN